MKKFLLLILLSSSSISIAQDTIYFDTAWKESLLQEASYYRVDEKPLSGKVDLETRTYSIDGQIKSLRSYRIEDDKKILEGEQKTWYDNGQLWYTENYRKGERHGELIAYWEDGSKRRLDVYKKGKLKSGNVWNRQGKEEEHFPVMIPASYPGGQRALAEFLRANLPVPDSQKKGTEVRLLVNLRINKEGLVDNIELIEGAPHWYNAVTITTLSNMPRWNPGKFMGEPVNVHFRLPVIFRK